jgi:hypothetical protein
MRLCWLYERACAWAACRHPGQRREQARRGVVTHTTIHGERVAAIVPESVIEAFRIFAAIVTSNESTLPLSVLQAMFPWARSLPPDEL